MKDAYNKAQRAIADLKSAIYELLEGNSEKGITNAEIGRALGIYMGHVGHEGHISRTLLAMMESEGVVEQNNENKQWRMKKRK